MKLRSVLTLAAFVACLGPAWALGIVTFVAVDPQTSQTPPQVFVRDTHASAESDEHGDLHIAGYRAPRPDDDPGFQLFDSQGNALYFTLEKWRAAAGTLDVSPDGNGDRVALNLHRLIAFGHYSIFVRSDGPDGPHFSPLDGSGITNNFDARQDGTASVSIRAPEHLAAGTWLVTIYHSDAADHGNSPGDFTRTAHQQLISKMP